MTNANWTVLSLTRMFKSDNLEYMRLMTDVHYLKDSEAIIFWRLFDSIKLAYRKRYVIVFPFCRITSGVKNYRGLTNPLWKREDKKYSNHLRWFFYILWRNSVILGGGQMGDKLMEKRLNINNLHIWVQFLALKIKQFMLYLQIVCFSLQKITRPNDKCR